MNKKGVRVITAALLSALLFDTAVQPVFALGTDSVLNDPAAQDLIHEDTGSAAQGLILDDAEADEADNDNISSDILNSESGNFTGLDDLITVPDKETESAALNDITDVINEDGGIYEGAGPLCDELNGILKEKDIMAVLYLCDTYPLRNAPSTDADAVKDIDCGTTLYLNSVTFSNGFWFDVTVYTQDGESRGYIPIDKLVCVDEDFLNWEKKLNSDINGTYSNTLSLDSEAPEYNRLGDITIKARESVYSFPDTYRDKLLSLLEKHPDWVFVPQKTGTTFREAVDAELEDKNRNWVYYTVDDKYKGEKINSSWYYASRAGLEHYMYPGNFVGSEQNIFMFEQLTYNASYHTRDGVQSVLKGTFMSGEIPGEGISYSQAFYDIGSTLKVSPYHLAARVYQEQGKGTSPLISGTYKGYEGYYNYFNIKASGSSNEEIYKNGLKYAKEQGWNTRYKSLNGGASFDSKNYILAGQDTPYLEKYNIIKKVYWHQYMQNASAPLTEASKVYSMYKNSGALNNPFVFKIPVFDGDTISPAKPVVNAKLVKRSNLFYTLKTEEALAQYTLTAADEIKKVVIDAETEKGYADSDRPYFTLDSYDKETGLITLKPVGLDPDNYLKIQKKVVLDITVEGYDEFTYELNVTTQDVKPTIKVAGTQLYGEYPKGSLAVTTQLPEGTNVSSVDPLMDVSLNKELDTVSFVVSEGFKAGSKKLEFSNDIWRAPVVVNVSIKKKNLPAIKVKKTTFKLNSALDCDLYGMQETEANLPGGMFDIEVTGISGVNEAAQALLDSGFVKYNVSGATLSVGLKPDKRDNVKAGTYRFNVNAKMSDPEYSMMTLKSVKISLQVVDRDPASLLRLTASGRIKLSDNSTFVKYTPKITDLNAVSVNKVSLEGENAGYFEAELYDKGSSLPDGKTVNSAAGMIIIYARDNTPLEAKVKYKVDIRATLDNGYEVVKTITIQPKQ